jgi:hypothetical protein
MEVLVRQTFNAGAFAEPFGAQQFPAPTDIQILAIVINFLFPGIALAVVVTRAAGRIATRQFGWDDTLISIAMLFSLGQTGVSYFCKHSWGAGT